MARRYSKGAKITAAKIGKKQARRAKKNPKIKKPTKSDYWGWVKGAESLLMGWEKQEITRRSKAIRKSKKR